MNYDVFGYDCLCIFSPTPKNFKTMIMPTYYFQCVSEWLSGREASRRMCCDLELLIKRICFETKNLYTHVNERLVPHETAKWNAMNWMTSIKFESFEDSTVDIEDVRLVVTWLSFSLHSSQTYMIIIWTYFCFRSFVLQLPSGASANHSPTVNTTWVKELVGSVTSTMCEAWCWAGLLGKYVKATTWHDS